MWSRCKQSGRTLPEAAAGPSPDSEPVMKELKDNMYAIIETGGKQYKVTEGDVLYIEKLTAEAGRGRHL